MAAYNAARWKVYSVDDINNFIEKTIPEEENRTLQSITAAVRGSNQPGLIVAYDKFMRNQLEIEQAAVEDVKKQVADLVNKTRAHRKLAETDKKTMLDLVQGLGGLGQDAETLVKIATMFAKLMQNDLTSAAYREKYHALSRRLEEKVETYKEHLTLLRKV
jgi:hypothetical protein